MTSCGLRKRRGGFSLIEVLAAILMLMPLSTGKIVADSFGDYANYRLPRTSNISAVSCNHVFTPVTHSTAPALDLLTRPSLSVQRFGHCRCRLWFHVHAHWFAGDRGVRFTSTLGHRTFTAPWACHRHPVVQGNLNGDLRARSSGTYAPGRCYLFALHIANDPRPSSRHRQGA